MLCEYMILETTNCMVLPTIANYVENKLKEKLANARSPLYDVHAAVANS
jgi:hypothetical protein